MSYLKILCSRNSISSAFKNYNSLLLVILNKNNRHNLSTLDRLKSILKTKPKVTNIALDYELSKIKNDVLLYEYEHSRYYLIIGIINFSLIVCWSYLSVMTFNEFISDPDLTTDVHSWPDYKKSVAENMDMYLKIMCLLFGFMAVTTIAHQMTRRVRHIILRKGGNHVRITCYSWTGLPNLGRHYDIPLTDVCARAYRNEYPQSETIQLKIKGQKYYFNVHKKGTFFNAELFDATVGLFRHF